LEKQLALSKNETIESIEINHVGKTKKNDRGNMFCACESTGTNEFRPRDFQIEKFNTKFF